MKTQHTPGPWRTGGCGDDGWRMIIGAQTRFLTAYKETYLTDIAATSCSDNPEEDLANARLIASAPDLLAALENQVNCWEAMLEHALRLEDSGMAYSCRNAIHHARAAIAKATGGAA